VRIPFKGFKHENEHEYDRKEARGLRGARCTAIMRGMELPRLQIPPRMRDAMSYDKFAGPVPRMLVLESDYWLDVACIHAAESLGWDIARVPVVMKGHMPREMVAELFEAVTAFRPDFVLTINLSGMDTGGLFARFFEDLALPYVAWFVDDPRTIIMDRTIYASPYAVALTWERAYTTYLLGVGFGEVHVLPLAAEISLFNAEPAAACSIPPAFVGNSMSDFARDEWAWISGYPELAIALHAAFDAGRVTREHFGRGLAAMLPPDLLGLLDPDQKRHAEMYCFIEGTRQLRVNTVQALEPEGLMVRGDDAWREYAGGWGSYLNYREELPEFYRNCEVNLNITSIQMATAANQRVFDCPAAGGFLLTDDQASLAELFDPETEVAHYRSMEECRDLLRFYRAHPQARRDVASRARQRILGEHTYQHRLQAIVRILEGTFGG
jgi:spore maturation protein CgeB